MLKPWVPSAHKDEPQVSAENPEMSANHSQKREASAEPQAVATPGDRTFRLASGVVRSGTTEHVAARVEVVVRVSERVREVSGEL